ncbi:3-dehydroquinate synthase [Salinisphaera japonica]|uniref:3-dehydroquinate synthase n=1 Tax=Salinisphaera japonica YTM-1 TaxID=1209778 RepID=A0A423PQR1_9GAMM|nr:3-dehydroquinate synthase [Salinisphaera japonica]ROO27930.1 3-dehydroquinate synthase [Salinisphaera japonica YTM-1]
MPRSDVTTLPVALDTRAYDIHIASRLIDAPAAYAGAIAGRHVLIVTNETVAPLYQARVMATLAEAHEVDTLVLPDGEATKSMATLDIITTRLLENRCGRDATIVALGGGVIGDLAGFAAAIYQRGIDFVQVPTTLLAQVDSSVGGKTGVNHPLGKNMIGAFHQPRRVLADIDVLDTLPAREFSAGMAEVIKYGLIRDPAFFDWLEANMPAIMARDPACIVEVIRRSCANKTEVVVADEREAGERALLNLGHTYGHALEAELGYGVWLHGEAVAAGMCMAADTSRRLGWLDDAQVARIEAVIAAAGLPIIPPPEVSAARIHDLMYRDKKMSAGALRLVLLKDIGHAVLERDYGATLAATLERYLAA